MPRLFKRKQGAAILGFGRPLDRGGGEENAGKVVSGELVLTRRDALAPVVVGPEFSPASVMEDLIDDQAQTI